MFNKTKLKQRMKELYEQGLPQEEIANVLNTEGFRTPHGRKFNQTYVSKYAIKLRVGRRQRKAKTRSDCKRAKRGRPVQKVTAAMKPKDMTNDKLALIDLFLNLDFQCPPAKKMNFINAVMEL